MPTRATVREEARSLVASLGVEGARQELYARHRARIDAIARAHRLPLDQVPPRHLLASDERLEHVQRLLRALRFLETEAAQAPVRRGRTHDLSRLAWLATRPGPRGAEALVILQDALHAHHGEAFDAAMAHARRRARRAGRPGVVIFSASMERAVQTHRAPDTQAFYRRHHWPFVVGTDPSKWREGAPVVWDTGRGANVHDWVGVRARHAAEARKDALARRDLIRRLLSETGDPWNGTIVDARAILQHEHDYPWTRQIAEVVREVVAEIRAERRRILGP